MVFSFLLVDNAFGSGTLTRGAIPLFHLIKMFSISKFSAFLTLGSGSGS
jgi:hypothetical protein